MKSFREEIPRGVIVSCQLDHNEPLHTPQHCALFALAAELGGAVAVRGDGIENLQEMRATVRLPVIGCTRGEFDDGWVLVTPTMEDVDRLVRLGVDVIALDATGRIRRNGVDGTRFLTDVRKRYPDVTILADVSSFEEGVRAADVGASAISTVLFGRTKETYDQGINTTHQLDLVYRLATTVASPVLAEGFIWNTQDASDAMEAGAYGVIVGGAITRPRVITRLFVDTVEAKRLD